ncbi:hypothetical protein BH11MYX4_BH11MYX4_55430 [soil metagenome]
MLRPFPSRLASSALAVALLIACGAPAPPAKQAAPKPAVDGPITVADWKDLCDAQAERARRCPGPPPEAIETCTERSACFGALVRGDVIRALAKCQAHDDCTRPCTIDRVTASLPMTPANRELEEACVARRVLCPALDCNALVRPVRSLDGESTTPLVECFKFEKSCLDVAACVLETMSPVIARVSRCAPGGLAGGDATGERPPTR